MSRAPGASEDPNASFAPTHWSVVTAAGDNQSSPERAHAALTELCRTYWPPLYTFVRSRGYSAHDAQDITQSFFVFLIEEKIYARVDRGKGKFRSFLLASIKNFLADHYDRAHALKRGGGHEFLSLDQVGVAEVESSFHSQSLRAPNEDCVFERTWAETLIRESLENVSRQYEAEGKERVFRELRVFLPGGNATLPAYSDLARQLAIPEVTLRSHIKRLRARYRDALRSEVRRTVQGEADVEAELRELLRVLTTA